MENRNSEALKERLKARVMRRVFGFWFLRAMAPLLIIEVIGFLIALYVFANFVFVGQVVDNALAAALGNPFKLVAYFWHSFLVARVEVKVILVGIAVAVGFFLRDINRGLIAYVMTRQRQWMK